ncbi:MAG: Gldg family protein, partial [Planctomycetota bacterium]
MSESNNMNNGLISGLSKNPIVMNFGAFLMAAIFALTCGIISWRLGRPAMAYIIWSGSLAVFSAGVGFVLANRNQNETSPENALRIGLIFLGGGIGFATAILGLFLPLMEYSDIFGGGLAQWRKNPNTVLLCAGLLFGGLALMFGSVMLAKNFEKSSVGLRRLLYGTNAFLTGMLLLTVLGVVNVLAYVPMGKLDFFNRTFDFTASGLYSISESTQNFLSNLKEPVKVYVLLPGNDPITDEVKTLLETFKTHSKNITWSSFSRDLAPQQLAELQEKYQIPDSLGLLVVYGSDQKPVYDFIKYPDLYSMPQQDRRRPDAGSGGFQFLGEAQLIKTITFLSEGKSQAGVFFTQGNGELSIDDKNPGSIAGIGTLYD